MRRISSSLAFVSLSLLLGVVGCSLLSSDGSTGAEEVHVIEDPVNFDRSAIQIAGFKIEAASVKRDVLELRISYSGGCEEHAFDLYSTRGIYESKPPQADVYLSHEGNGDACRQLIRKELTFDLSPLKNPSGSGALRLRLHQYQAAEPIRPMPLYEY